MADLLARLAERTLGVTEVARPLAPAVFAPLPQLVDSVVVSPAPSSADHAYTPRPELDVSRFVPKTAQAQGSVDLPFAPRRTMPQPGRTSEDADPTAKTQQPPSRVAKAVRPGPREDLREPERGLLEEPVAGQRRGVAAQSRSSTMPPRSGDSHLVTAATDPQPQDKDISARRDEHRKDNAATSGDASHWRQPALLAIPAAPRTSARPASRENDRVSRREQPDSIVQINIGRIEVRALFPQPHPLPQPPVRRAASALSLADYLKERDRGAR